MKQVLWLILVLLSAAVSLMAQAPVATPAATETIQQSQSGNAGPSPMARETVAPANLRSQARVSTPIKIPAGTPIEVEVAYTVNSRDIKPGELLSFRVLIPVIIDGAIAVEKDALVTARVTVAKRGGHWGKAGRLAWAMEDVVAADNSRVRLDPATRSRTEALWSLENKSKDGKPSDTQQDKGSVKGISHSGEVATMMIVRAAIFPPLAPLALMHGFKRGENAVLPEGKRYVVEVRGDTSLIGSPKN